MPWPFHRSCMLQAESEKLRQAWIQAVQASIASAYRESPDSYYIEVSTHFPLRTTLCLNLPFSFLQNIIRWTFLPFQSMFVLRLYLASGQNSLSIHQQHRFSQWTAGAQHQGGDHPAAHPVSAGERAVLWLWSGRPSLGLNQPGHPAVHRVLRHPQVERRKTSFRSRRPKGNLTFI